jgi:hypothetical protein
MSKDQGVQVYINYSILRKYLVIVVHYNKIIEYVKSIFCIYTSTFKLIYILKKKKKHKSTYTKKIKIYSNEVSLKD